MSAGCAKVMSLSGLVERELTRVSLEAQKLSKRRPHLDERDEQSLHDLWEYEKRLRFLNVFAAMADPQHPIGSDTLVHIQSSFREALIKYGSATEDNLRAAHAISLGLRRTASGESELALQLGSSPTTVADLLLRVCDIVGTTDFYSEHLSDVTELKELTPDLWEQAYRVVMLTVCALFTSPRHEGHRP